MNEIRNIIIGREIGRLIIVIVESDVGISTLKKWLFGGNMMCLIGII
jgi:hypothetical protein